MIFNISNRWPFLAGVVLLVLAQWSFVDAAVNTPEKSDKIAASNPSVKGVSKAAVSKAWVLQAEQWELARSGESILSLPVLNQMMHAWLLDRKKKIEIQYPGGEEGELWVQQLSDWLVALGVPSERLITVPGSGADDMIKFGLIK